MGVTPNGSEHRFPGFDVIDSADKWDEVTKGAVLGRLLPSQRLRFFGPDLEPTARALVDRLLAQDEEPKVPVIEVIDHRLLGREGDGYRYEDMPEDGEAWRRSIEALDLDARSVSGRPFWDLSPPEQMQVVEAVRQHDGEWHGLPAKRVFGLWMRYACDAFYAHPWAWNEIGFGGPAYPRGYKNLGLDRREEWEVRERHARDPIPWVEQAERARKEHADRLPSPPGGGEGKTGSDASDQEETSAEATR